MDPTNDKQIIYVSLHQLLLYQMGYLLFHKLNEKHANIRHITERLKILQTAYEQLKSYQNNTYYHTMIDNFDFELDEEEVKELNESNTNMHDTCTDTQYIHPFGFGIWLQEQSFIHINWTGTMDDSQTTKSLWRDLTGATFIKQWKKSNITAQNIIIQNTKSSNDAPYLDISMSNNSVVDASQFRISLHKNRIFKIELKSNRKCTQNTMLVPQSTRKSRGSIDHSVEYNDDAVSNINTRKHAIQGIDLFNKVMNVDTLRIACCILWEPQLAYDVLKEFLIDPSYDINGKHKEVMIMKEEDSLSTSCYDENAYRLELPLASGIGSFSVGSSPIAPSVASLGRFSNISTNTSYTGNCYLDESVDMKFEDIYQYLMEMDYADKKNPVKYEWKLIVNALNAFQFKVISIDDYTDNDILNMVNEIQEGLVNSIHDQRSGLIKVACHLFVLLAQYRTPLFFDEEFFKFWMICLLRKCANRDKIRTLPAHNACSDMVACIVSFYVNNKDYLADVLLNKLKNIFVIFCGLWTPGNIDPLWMKQEKSVTQFIKNISLMIRHIAMLCDTTNEEKRQIQNEDIKEMQQIAFDLFQLFQKQSHKEARVCAVQLLSELYKLDKDKTFEFAKEHFSNREFVDYLKRLNNENILNLGHKQYLESHKTMKKRTRIKRKNGRHSNGIKKKKKRKKKSNKNKTEIINETTAIPEDLQEIQENKLIINITHEDQR